MRRDHETINPTLRRIARAIYQMRTPLPENQHTVFRPEIVDGRPYADMWFMTGGCKHDIAGGCTMCNYGKGERLDDADILSELEQKVKGLSLRGGEVTITPSGSFFDEREVSASLRQGVISLVAGLYCSVVTIETRVDTVRRPALEEVAEALGATAVCIELGLEALDDWVLRNCLNKGMKVQAVADVIPLIHECGMRVIGNLGVGLPFLSERASMSLATASVRLAQDLGLDRTTLFPYHVKPGTVVGELLSGGMYQCVSLWSLIEIISSTSNTGVPLPQISWYRNYYRDPGKVLASPTTCPLCYDRVTASLDQYRDQPTQASADHLTAMNCPCRQRWRERLEQEPDGVSVDDVAAKLSWLAARFGLSPEDVEEDMAYMRGSFGQPQC